jgi:CheY-like chemotaxis protein
VKVSFVDSGIGMPKDVLPRIFDPFYTTKTQGHGLGLATCYSIVIRHGRHIEAESGPGRGSTFQVYLPALAEIAPPEELAPLRFHGQGVMIVTDDEEVVRVGVRKMLERIGLDVVCTSDGREAVDVIIAEGKTGRSLPGMLCDLTIRGGMGGKETIGEVRRSHSKMALALLTVRRAELKRPRDRRSREDRQGGRGPPPGSGT